MAPTSRLYNALNDFLRQCDIVWQDARHLQTLCWMIIGIIQSQNVHLNGFGVYVVSRAQLAQSHQRRFRRWLSNRRIDVVSAHQVLIQQALSQWQQERLYLSLDTTLVWNCFCIVWVGVVYRGRTIPIASANCRPIQQCCQVMDDSTGTAASRTSDARWLGNCPIGRPGLCRW
jgi:hypothetical protein